MSNCLNDWFVDGADSRCRCRREVQRFYYNLVVRPQQADAVRLGRENLKAASTKMAPVLTATGVLTATADFHHLGFFSFLAVFATVLAVLFWRTITCWVRAFAGIIVSHRSDLLKVSVGWIYSDGGGFTIMLGAVTRAVKCGDSRVVSYFDFSHLCALASWREITSLIQDGSRKCAKPQRKTANEDLTVH